MSADRFDAIESAYERSNWGLATLAVAALLGGVWYFGGTNGGEPNESSQ